jgi:hypothetical protein
MSKQEVIIDIHSVNTDCLPPEDIDLVFALVSGIQVVGRNLGGRCCFYEPARDRFVEAIDGLTDKETWKYVTRYFVIPKIGL